MTKAELFRDWFNNFLTVERFAEYYALSVVQAERLIKEGRQAHEAGAAIFKQKHKGVTK